MGAKSTVVLTRAEAERRLVDLQLEEMRPRLARLAALIPDAAVEDAIEELNDRAHGGEGLESYLIGGGG